MFSTLLLLLFAALLTLSAAFHHDLSSLSARHNRLARRVESDHVKAELHRMTKRRYNPDSCAKPKSHSTDATSGAGLIQVTSSECGPSGATKDTTPTSGPNGSIYWLNCGIGPPNDNGWNPPNVTVDQLIYRNLTDLMDDPNNIFKLCAAYVPIFEKYGDLYEIPPIMMAAFAMQESTCNAAAVGQGGEQGLMQISKEKCGGVSDCKDPDFNIRTATKFFCDLLKSNMGNVLLSLGMYNGWSRKMTHADATAAAKSSCCHCQQDLSYLHDMVNAGLQGIDSHDLTPPQIFDNLAICATV